jgi:hypothetical protein
MKKIFLLLVLSLFILGCVQQSGVNQNTTTTTAAQPKINASPTVEPLHASISITADKNNYSSYQQMNLFVSINASQKIEKASLKVWGIKPRDYAFVQEEKNVSIARGVNEFLFLATTPRCTAGCGGVYPGPYQIFAELYFNESLAANASTTINLVSG